MSPVQPLRSPPETAPARVKSTVVVSSALWESGALLAADLRVRAAEDLGGPVEVVAEELAHAGEVALRYQRLAPRTNAASAQPAFQRLLERHRALHDPRKPAVRAELERAHDTWQWVLRLEPEASAEVQLAALLHGGERAGELLAQGLWDTEHVEWLLECHERPQSAPGPVLLADADALSFFALQSAGYLERFGSSATRMKVAHTLARSSKRVWRWLRSVRLPRPVRSMVDALVH